MHIIVFYAKAVHRGKVYVDWSCTGGSLDGVVVQGSRREGQIHPFCTEPTAYTPEQGLDYLNYYVYFIKKWALLRSGGLY